MKITQKKHIDEKRQKKHGWKIWQKITKTSLVEKYIDEKTQNSMVGKNHTEKHIDKKHTNFDDWEIWQKITKTSLVEI